MGLKYVPELEKHEEKWRDSMTIVPHVQGGPQKEGPFAGCGMISWMNWQFVGHAYLCSDPPPPLTHDLCSLWSPISPSVQPRQPRLPYSTLRMGT